MNLSSPQARILYVGPDYYGSNGTCWRDAFLDLGQDVRTVDSEGIVTRPRSVAQRALHKLTRRAPASQIARLNQAVRDAAREYRPDLTFYIQARYILADTLDETRRFGPNCAYMNDDMINPANQTFTFAAGLPKLDWIFTTKSYNVAELQAAGAPRVVFISNAYDPKIHFPAQPSAEERVRFQGDVLFIGTFRPERADFLARLADAIGSRHRVNVWGPGFDKMNRPSYLAHWASWRALRLCLRGPELWGVDMAKAIQSNQIVLGLLNHANRDLHTSRSFEIPACGGFMLAERTDEHRRYFQEGKEAAYFGSFEELLEKVDYYLAHENERVRIAAAALKRCQISPYRYVDLARQVVCQTLGQEYAIRCA